VVIPSYGLTGTTAISAVMLVCFIPTVLIASLLRKKVPQPWRAVFVPADFLPAADSIAHDGEKRIAFDL